MQVRLEGPAVVPLQTGFALNWQQTTGELISGDLFYPIIDRRGSLAVQTLLSSPETGASTVRTMYNLSIVSLDDVNGCERVTVERWQRRGAWARSQELVASFLQEQA